MNALCPAELCADETLYGAGLHVIPPGGWLDLHVDAQSHPVTGHRRTANLILFLDSWKPDWGGALEFWDATVSRREVEIFPAAGRLVAFESAGAVHGIPSPISPFANWRRSLAVFWYNPEPEHKRAKFLANSGDPTNAAADAWRAARARD